ncbi:helix-turn-helix domain-containing protein [Xylocopilactobacillus apicola]|uniref:AraC family transcriptional regulator n=1 Tax=Xylocopilactobacillus apicola TaxID=2932184 RepID=A0AAU9DM67_9LACO|nr:AraC family transcriptional regulator [Xylocopilactobacillus apicola]BDR58002.1 AraC family transcriptional regulator [Xylocopilactobacillus apicola]
MQTINLIESFPFLRELDCYISDATSSKQQVSDFYYNPKRLISGFYYRNCPQAQIENHVVALIYVIKGSIELGKIKLTSNQVWLSNGPIQLVNGQHGEFICFLFKTNYFISRALALTNDDLVFALLKNSAEPLDYAFDFDTEPTIGILAFLLLRQIVKMSYQKNEITNSACALLLDELATNQDKISYQSRQEDYSLKAVNILNYCQNHLSSCSLDQLANHFHVHPNYISMLVKKETGDNLSTILKRYRFNLARRLLRESDLTIENIAQFLGYNDLSHFYKTFKQETGLTPKQYRKS